MKAARQVATPLHMIIEKYTFEGSILANHYFVLMSILMTSDSTDHEENALFSIILMSQLLF